MKAHDRMSSSMPTPRMCMLCCIWTARIMRCTLFTSVKRQRQPHVTSASVRTSVCVRKVLNLPAVLECPVPMPEVRLFGISALQTGCSRPALATAHSPGLKALASMSALQCASQRDGLAKGQRHASCYQCCTPASIKQPVGQRSCAIERFLGQVSIVKRVRLTATSLSEINQPHLQVEHA